jgi:murein DD-endopeptidase MepM/ murein hydrolase activator NlpD
VLRFIAIASCGAVVWMAGLSGVPTQVRLPVTAVVVGAAISQPFGCTNLELEPFDVWCPTHHIHTGVDLAAPQGTEVFSATSGVVSAGYDSAGAGNFVAIQFDRRTRILYCHLSAFRVKSGQHVEPGQVIGLVGATGLATGPHVHFEIDVRGVPVDPSVWLAATP